MKGMTMNVNTQSEIAVPIDFLEETNAARNAARLLCRHSKARLHYIHVNDDALERNANAASTWTGVQPGFAEIQEKIREAARQNLSELLSKEENAKGTLLEGNPPTQVKTFVSENSKNISFVALSKKRRQFFGELFFGSVAHEVVQTCSCPALIMPDEKKFESWTPQKIVVAMSLSDGSDDALRTAADLARDRSSELILIHIVELDQTISDYAKSFFPRSRDDGAEVLSFDAEQTVSNHLDRIAKSLELPEGKVSTAVRFGSVVEVLSHFVQEVSADLLVTGSHSKAGIKRSLFGSIPSALCRSARFPLLVVPHIKPNTQDGRRK